MLPIEAQIKLEKLQTLANEARAASKLAVENVERQSHLLEQAKAQFVRAGNPKEAERLQEDVNARLAMLEQAKSDRDQKGKAANERAQVVTQLQSFRPGGNVAYVEPPAIALEAGETLVGRVESVRAQIKATKAEKALISQARMTDEELIGKVADYVHGLAAQYAPTVDPQTGAIRRQSVSFGDSTSSYSVGLGIVAWLYPEQLIQRLTQVVHELPGSQLSAAEKASKTRELDAAILDLERVEESLIERAEATGHFIPRRKDANPMAVLCLSRV